MLNTEDEDLVEETLNQIDRNKDGEVCFEEFSQMMKLLAEEKKKEVSSDSGTEKNKGSSRSRSKKKN